MLPRTFPVHKHCLEAKQETLERMTDFATLDEWLDNVLDAETLEAVGVPIKN